MSLRVGARKALLTCAILMYPAGCVVTSGMVRDACFHPNCIHGWYSKYNTMEKAIALAWAFGFPVVLLAFDLALREWTGEAREEQKQHAAERERRVEAERLRFLESMRGAPTARSRKTWNCTRCGEQFGAGTTYLYRTRWADGYSRRVQYCTECCREPMA